MTKSDNNHIPDLTITIPVKHELEFVVLANDWPEVIDILKDELGITEKRNSSSRNVAGYYLISTRLNQDDLTHQFYEKVRASTKLSIISDKYSNSLRDRVLTAVASVEIQLRRLAVHIVDLVDDNEMRIRLGGIVKGSVDPSIAALTFDQLAGILSKDISWANKAITAVELQELMSASATYDDLRKTVEKKVAPRYVWDDLVSEHVLAQPVSWESIKDRIAILQKLRNQAAHFRVVRATDVHQAEKISEDLIKVIGNQKRHVDIAALKESVESLRRSMELLSGQSRAEMSASSIVHDLAVAQLAQLRSIGMTEEEYRSALLKSLANITSGPKEAGTAPMDEAGNA